MSRKSKFYDEDDFEDDWSEDGNDYYDEEGHEEPAPKVRGCPARLRTPGHAHLGTLEHVRSSIEWVRRHEDLQPPPLRRLPPPKPLAAAAPPLS